MMCREDRAIDTILPDVFASDELAEAGHGGHHLVHRLVAGVFAGDAYRTSVHCEPNGNARVESSSATKVYSMPNGGASTQVELSAEPGSHLVWGPHATILHTGASLRQDTRVTLHEGATVLMADTLVMGRIAAGQRFDFASFASALTVQGICGSVRYTEAYDLHPGENLEAAMGGLGVVTVVYGLGRLRAEAPDRLDELCNARQLTGWSKLPGHCGLVVKALTDSLSQGTAVAREALAMLGG